jgi:hypothetical protein
MASIRQALSSRLPSAAFRRSRAAPASRSTSCREIIFELLTTIRDDANPELASNARALYAFMYRSLVEGAHEKDDAKLGSVASLLDYERETWVMLMQKLAEERGQRTGTNPAAAAPSDAARTGQLAPAMAISVQG